MNNKDISKWRPYNLSNNFEMFKNKVINLPYWYKDNKEERKEQIDLYYAYHLNKKIENNLTIKKENVRKI